MGGPQRATARRYHPRWDPHIGLGSPAYWAAAFAFGDLDSVRDQARIVWPIALLGVGLGFLVGTVEREIPIYRLAEFGFIHDLWVEPAYRNEGVARQMVMVAVETLESASPSLACSATWPTSRSRSAR